MSCKAIVPLPQGKKPISCKWIFKLKLNSDGIVARHKARLVAKGFTQQYGLDFLETFSPVAKITTLRLLISLAASNNWHLAQLDINNVFFNGTLLEEIFHKAINIVSPRDPIHHMLQAE